MQNSHESSIEAKNESQVNKTMSNMVFSATEAQKRFWFIQQLLPESSVFNVSRVFRIHGQLDYDALHYSINSIVKRHEGLRITFDVEANEVVQIVRPYLEFAINVNDMSHRSNDFQNIIDKNLQEPFDLVNSSMLRVYLLKCGEKEHIFQVVCHRIICDKASLDIFNKELGLLYKSCVSEISPIIPELKAKYEDYVTWLAQETGSDSLKGCWKYWRKQFEDYSPMSLPYDKSKPAGFDVKGGRVEYVIDLELINKLRIVGIENDSNLFTVLLSAFNTLIFRWSGEEKVRVVSPVRNRQMKEAEHIFGLFEDMIILQSELSDELTFIELLRLVNTNTSLAIENNRIPFGKIVEEFNHSRENNQIEIVDLLFELQTVSSEPLSIENATLSELSAQSNCSHYDLGMRIKEREDSYKLVIEYRSELFNRNTIESLVGRFSLLLKGIAQEPNKFLSYYDIILPEEKEKLLVEWNNTDRNYETSSCLHHFFETQVTKTPERIAIEFEGQSLTYEELNSRANQLAHYLRQKGVTQETRVGVCMERSIEMVISLYGILKSGGCYVPLDPDYPQARLSFMLEDISAPIVLTHSHLGNMLPKTTGEIICLDSDWNLITEFSCQNPQAESTSDNLAYIIYTSGSTGRPKGVMNQHSGIVNRLIWMQEEYRLTDTDVVLQKTPYSFDVSVWEFFWPLMFGSKLVVAKPNGHQDVAYLSKIIDEKEVSTMHFVPSMLQLFLDKANPEKCHSLRQVFCSGEALSYELQNQFFEFSTAKLHNLYGPTEAAVDVTYWQCDRNYSRSIVPIGKPVANTKLYILDKYLKPVPIGSSGELHIGGAQVARGYLNRPQLTQEKFIPDPYSKDSNAKLYKTGDLARYLDGGEIEYLGRIDFQVKIRGLRIELGEIESQLNEIEEIKQCVVIVREDEPNNKRIVAYIVEIEDGGISNEEIRKQLSIGLPSYMIPQVFVKMDLLPLSPNGKIDRKSLPIPTVEDFESDNQFVAPTSRIEKAIAGIWSELLEIENISVYDKFLELGGQSMLVLEAVWKAKKKYNIKLEPVALIRDTLEQIAASVEGEGAVQRLSNASQKKLNYEPFYFGGDESLYGVHQWPSNNVKDRGAVLLCNSIYLESFNTHRAFRQLSSQLAEAGYHVLKFDYFGTGDSYGNEDEASVDRWLKDIQVAGEELSQRSGHKEFSVLGFRFGAILSAMSKIEGIDKLVLWEPVFNGAEYVEQLYSKYRTTLSDLNYIRTNPTIEQKGEIVGFKFPESIERSLSHMELLNSRGKISCNQLISITSNPESELYRYNQELAKLTSNSKYVFVDDSIIPIENYDDIDSYLPGKSLNEIVSLMKGEDR